MFVLVVAMVEKNEEEKQVGWAVGAGTCQRDRAVEKSVPGSANALQSFYLIVRARDDHRNNSRGSTSHLVYSVDSNVTSEPFAMRYQGPSEEFLTI